MAQTVEVRILDGVCDTSLPGLPCKAADGWVVVGDDRHENVIPLPFDSRGAVHLWLQLAEQTREVGQGLLWQGRVQVLLEARGGVGAQAQALALDLGPNNSYI